MEPLPVHNRSRWGETERMELSPTTRRRQFSSANTPPAKTILAIMALFRVSLDQPAPSRIRFQTRKSSGTWSWASTMRTLPFWSGYGPSTATTMNDNDGTVGIDDGRWSRHRDGPIEWRRGHRAAIDYSRAEQAFDSITTRYPRERRDELAGRDDLNKSYVSGVTRGLTRMAG